MEEPVQDRARRYLAQCAPHHRAREWYKLIDELVGELPDRTPQNVAQDLLEGFNKGLEGKELITYASRRLPVRRKE